LSKGTIFDVDGCLIRTRIEYFRNIIQMVIDELGRGEFSFERVDRFLLGNADISRSKSIEVEFEVDFKDFIEPFRKYTSDFEYARQFKSLYDDVIPVLTELRKKEVVMGVVTDAPSYIALPQLNYFIGDGYFSEVVMTHGMEGVKDKPEPDGLLLCMERIGMTEGCFVGDSDSDIVAAKRAGVEAVLIDRGEHENYVEPDRRIKSLYELL